MAASEQTDSLTRTAGFLRGKANRYAWVGLCIALAALLIGTVLASFAEFGGGSLDSLLAVQHTNPALWLLDFMPLLFLAWGQQVGTVISYEAGAMMLDQTRALRDQATALEYQLERNAAQPRLTDLPDQRSFAGKLARAIIRRSEHQGRCAVLAIDTRLYHEVALAQGAEAAREFIDQVAQRLRSVLEENSLIGHFGYDDFAILVRDLADAAEAQTIARRLQQALDTPLQVRRQPMSLRSSIGIALYPDHGGDAETLIRRAETAKYAASAGGHECLLYEASLDNARSEVPRLIAELHAALDHDGLSVEELEQHPLQPGYAPGLRMRTRWLHPRRGRMQQSAFIDLPGRDSLIHTLTLWQLREACILLVGARREMHPQAGLSLRLPASAYSELPLAQTLTSLLRAHDLPPESLSLELREAALLDGGKAVSAQLAALREAGLRLCLCGVGAPGASPACLLDYPIGEARLAPALLRRALDSSAAHSLLDSTIEQLRRLQATVIVSGADTPALLELARASDADYAEGLALPHAARAAPAAIATALAASPANPHTDGQIVL